MRKKKPTTQDIVELIGSLRSEMHGRFESVDGNLNQQMEDLMQ